MYGWPAFLLALALQMPLAAQQRSPFADDTRLDKPVTVHWKKTALSDALQELSQATGVRLNADGPLVDEPVMASATEIPARVLLEQMAQLLHFTWIRSGGTQEEPNYTLLQSQAARAEEQAQIDGARRVVLEALRQQFARYRQISRLPPEQLQSEIQKAEATFAAASAAGLTAAGADPHFGSSLTVRSVASPIGGAMLDLLDSLTPHHWNLLLNGQPLVFSTRPVEGEGALPRQIQDRLRAAVPQLSLPKALFTSFGPKVEDTLAQGEQVMQEQWRQADGFKVTVQMTLSLGARPLGMLRASPAPLGVDDLTPMFSATGLTLSAAPPRSEAVVEDPAEREKRLAADPVLGKMAVLELQPPTTPAGSPAARGQSYSAADVLPAVEKAYGVKLLGDAYTRQALARLQPPANREMPLFKVLDLLAGSGRTWEREGDLIRFRSRTWAHDRRAEIPLRSMRQWLALRDKQGSFSLDDVSQIAAALRDEQVASLVSSAREAGSRDIADFAAIAANRDVLRFYAQLPPVQRQRLQTGQPLPAQALMPAHRALLASLNRGHNPSMRAFVLGAQRARSAEQLAAAALRLERKEDGAAAVSSGSPGGDPTAVRTGAGSARRRVVYTLRLVFPNGEQEEYNIPLVSSLPPTAASVR